MTNGEQLRSIRVGLAQINCTVGDLAGNVGKIKDQALRALEQEVDLLAFPELAICGYPPEDLLFKPQFRADCRDKLAEVVSFSSGLGGMVLVVGCVDGLADIHNAAAIIEGGKLHATYRKVHLPNYGVFDEERYFKRGQEALVVTVKNVSVGISICEDIWHPGGPAYIEAAGGGADLIVNLNASPFHLAKGREREAMLSGRAIENLVDIAYVNMVGGQDELVFDGHSLIINRLGAPVAAGRRFEEDLVVADLDVDLVVEAPRPRRENTVEVGKSEISVRRATISVQSACARKRHVTPVVCGPLPEVEEAYLALRLGVADYVRKNGFSRAVIGLSGGVDSALTAAIAADALGKANVTTVFLPSRYTSDDSRFDAEATAANLGVDFLTISIEPIFQAYLEALKAIFAGGPVDVTEENLQARIRGNILMALSNKFGWLLLSTGNKSEMSVGYATLYGDMSGGFSVLKDVSKTLVYQVSRYFNNKQGWAVIPERVLIKPPSAELRPDQKDADSLPEYEILDPIVEAYVEEDKSLAEMVRDGADGRLVAEITAMIDKSEYKRRQAPPGVKITGRAFGRDWRLPITNWYKERFGKK